MTTISTDTTTGLVLTGASFSNPVTIASGVTVTSGSGVGVNGAGQAWQVVNAGSIDGSTAGVRLRAGGTVSNLAGGTISASAQYGVWIESSAGTVVNDGVIVTDGASYGVRITSGGAVTNSASGQVSGVAFAAGGGTIVNAGSIDAGLAGTSYGVADFASAGLHVTNLAGGLIRGNSGIYGYGGTTITNAGTIAGAGGPAIVFGGYDGHLLVVSPGAAFDGAVNGSNHGTNTLELASASSSGTVSGLGDSFTNFGTVQVDAGARWVLAGANTLVPAATLTNLGTLSVAGNGEIGGGLSVDGTLVNAGTLSTASAGVIGVVVGNGLLLNQGSVQGGVALGSAGMLTNAASAVIDGGLDGVFADGAATFVNAGRIAGSTDGVRIAGLGLVTNEAAATIAGGGFGVTLGDVGTVITAGTITGGNGTAVAFGGVGANRLELDPGAAFVGSVVAPGYPSTNVIELRAAAAAGTLTGLGTAFVNFAQVTIDAGAAWTLSGANTVAGSVASYGALTNAGTLAAPVYLFAGAGLTNLAGALITGPTAAVVGTVAGQSLTNAGAITGALYGVRLAQSGQVTNLAGALITASGQVDGDTTAGIGLDVQAGTGSIVNAGTVQGPHVGVLFTEGGSLTNTALGAITATDTAVLIAGGPSASLSVLNAGRIAAAGMGGVGLLSGVGGTVVNDAAGSISGGSGVNLYGSSDTITNRGAIIATGSAGLGVALRSGRVVNEAGATISSAGYGVSLYYGGTLVNGGTIIGSDGTAFSVYNGAAPSRVIIDPGAVFVGVVKPADNGGNTLELASAATAGAISGLGTSYVNFGTVAIDSGAHWSLSGDNALGDTSTLVNAGVLTLTNATLTTTGVFENDGQVVLDPSTLSLASLTGTGSVTIAAGSTLTIQGAVSAGETIAFASGAQGRLLLGGAPSAMAGTLAGLAAGDIVDVTALAFVDGVSSASVASHVLTVDNGSAHVALATSGLADGALVYLQDDGAGGTDITLTPPPPADLALTADSDSGVQDGITNITRPAIAGTTVRDGVVKLYAGGSLVGAGAADASGAFRVTVTVPLAEGADSITATVTNPDGNVSTASAPLTLTINTAPPPAPVGLALTADSDSAAAGDGITNVALPSVTGTAPPGSIVSLYDGVALLGTGLADEAGAWSITASAPLTDGASTLTATATNDVGTASAASAPLAVTYLAAAAAPAGLALAPASDSGVAGDGLTNVALPVVTGTAHAGDAISLSLNDTLVGTAVAGAGGTWTITAGTPLSEGSNTLTATALDAAGNVSDVSAGLAVTRDTAVPDAPAGLALAPASDSGVAGDGRTSRAVSVITGSAAPFSTVALYDGASLVGTGVADGDGIWSIAAALAEGPNNLTATASSAAGNVSAPSAAVMVVLDRSVPPAPAGLALTADSDSAAAGDGITNVALPSVTGTAPPGSIVSLYDGVALLGTGLADEAGAWSITASAPLTDGASTLTATATNDVGTASAASAPLAVTYLAAAAAPAGLALAPASDSGVAGDGLTNVALPVVTGRAHAGDAISLYLGGAVAGGGTAGNDGSFAVTLTTPLSLGVNGVVAQAVDAAGNISARSTALLVTRVPPNPNPPTGLQLAPESDSGLPGDDRTNITRPTILGRGEPGDTVSLRDGTVVVGTAIADANGSWVVTTGAPLANGVHSFTANQTNADGAASTASNVLSLTVDTTRPAAPAGLALAAESDSGAAGDGVTSVAAPVLTGSASAGQTVTIMAGLSSGAVVLGVALADGAGAWRFSPAAFADGRYSITATATNDLGTASASSAALTLTVDTAAPTVRAAFEANPSTALTPGVTYAEGLVGQGDPKAFVTITEAGTTVGTAQAAADGSWFFDPSGLKPGPHTFTAQETDAAGNIGRSAAVSATLPDPRFHLTNVSRITSGTVYGGDYTGPVSFLSAECSYTGADNVVLGAQVANVYLRSGAGEDALAAFAGSNVLDGSTGSNWLVGASGADGGNDTFFVDGSGGQNTWDTLLNFHPGDMLTLWGFDALAGSTAWSDNQGAAGYQGATMHAAFGGPTGGFASVTFEGLSTSTATFTTSSGTTGGLSYLAIFRTA